jgi:uncharacterized membrane protein affecting hemolysin expression
VMAVENRKNKAKTRAVIEAAAQIALEHAAILYAAMQPASVVAMSNQNTQNTQNTQSQPTIERIGRGI